MNKLIALTFAIVLGCSIGCGGDGVPPSAAAPTTTPEQDMKKIEQAMESKQIDPATYGK
ncbi:MAG TPA: hypothetical protein P5307_01735 [Pirellulaceae bacterium]|nr:hypothetical protein [Planctomycetales bacterium]HRX77747.1 hypothetical protein [Pirellulaceae bacterium]